MQPYGQNDPHRSSTAQWMSTRFKKLQASRQFLAPSEAYWLGSGRSPVPTEIYRRQTRSFRRVLAVNRGSTVKDRRWHNPERRRHPKPKRFWVEAEESSALLETGEDKFVILSYNILGVNNSLEHPDLYMNVPFDAMQWESRKQLICEDIRRSNADIVCLQEVDRHCDLEFNLKKEGYIGRYKPRTGFAKDGCAIFWKNKRFHLLEEHKIEFNTLGLRDNVAQLLVFETAKQQGGSRRVLIGNIHVLFNPKRGDIKLGQVRVLLQHANILSENWGGIPIVLAGDFNSTPESAIYEFLSTSELCLTRHDRKCLSGQETLQPTDHGFSGSICHSWTDEELKNAAGYSSCNLLRHPLKLRSSYACVKGSERTRVSCGEPLATTFHTKFMGTVDYLWYSGDLEPARVLDTLPISTLRSIGGLPSKDIGSDHLHLACEFVFIPRSTNLKSQDQGTENEEISNRIFKSNRKQSTQNSMVQHQLHF